MPAWKRNQPVAAKRRVTIAVYDLDGALAPPTTSFSGTGELLVDKGDGSYVAAGGTLVNATRPLSFTLDDVEAVDTGANSLQFTAHGLLTGDGPFEWFTTTSLPGGLALATQYWVVKVDDNNVKMATSLANALAGTVVDITSSGSGTNSLVGSSATRRLNDGEWVYEATQAEINYHGTYFAIRISKPGVVQTRVHNVDLEDNDWIHEGTVAAVPSSTQVTLDAAASSLNDFYNGAVIVIIAGTGIGQFRTINDYTGGTKIADIDRGWTTNPDTTSKFVILAAVANANTSSIASAVWNVVGEGVHTYGDLIRGIISLNGCTVTDFQTGVLVFKSINGAKTRWTMNTDPSGRLSIVVGDLTI